MATTVSENGDAGEEISQTNENVEPKVNGELNGSHEEPMEIDESPVKQVKKINASDINSLSETDNTVIASDELNSVSEISATNLGENELTESQEISSNGCDDKESESQENKIQEESIIDSSSMEEDDAKQENKSNSVDECHKDENPEGGNNESESITTTAVLSETGKEDEDDDDVVLMEDEETVDPLAVDTKQLESVEGSEDKTEMDCERGNINSPEIEKIVENDPLMSEKAEEDLVESKEDEDKKQEKEVLNEVSQSQKDSAACVDEQPKENISKEAESTDSTEKEENKTEKPESSEEKLDDSLDKSKTEEDNEKTPDGKGKKKKNQQQPVNITPRRSSRNVNKPKLYVDEPDIKPQSTPTKKVADDPDIEEIVPQDPLAMDSPVSDKKNKKAVLVNDPKRLVEIASSNKQMKPGKKEPTLVIIDTNSILSGRGPVPVSPAVGQTSISGPSRSQGYSILPMALPAQGMYPQPMSRQPHLKPMITSQPATPSPPPPAPKPPVILPSLTDDMYVVEAPSFIVPYVYEKPPIKPLKGFVEQVEQAIKEIKAHLEKEKERENAEKEKERAEKEKERAEKEKERSEKEKEDAEKEKEHLESKESDENKTEAKDKSDSEEKKADDSSIEGEQKEKQEGEEKMEVEGEDKEEKSKKKEDKDVIIEETTSKDEKMEVDIDGSKTSKEETETTKKDKEIKEPEKSTDEKVSSTKSDTDKPSEKQDAKPEEGEKKKSSSYFDNPLGKFFIQIGVNLVQEHVQTDLLRSQKRKKEREGAKCTPEVQQAMNSLIRSLEFSRETNEPFKLELKKCEFCSFKTESALVMAHHLETPHMRNYVYRCNFCALEVRSPHDILYHMEAEHNVRGRLERAPAFHQCPSCPFEDNQKGKLGRHLLSCAKKYRPERNQEPPLDFEPPAKIPRVSRNRTVAPMSPGTAVYQAAMSGLKQTTQHPLLPKLVPAASPSGLIRGRGRPQMMNRYLGDMRSNTSNLAAQQKAFAQMRPGMLYRPSGSNSQPQVLLPASYQLAGTQLYQNAAAAVAAANAAVTKANVGSGSSSTAKLLQQPSISITPLPRPTPPPPAPNQVPPVNKPGRPAGGSKATFVICEICDGYIKDLEQLRNHMQWIHKVKIHPKMIYNRPPLNCQKCQFRFFTDQGLERHLLGSHGLVTSSMQEAANKGKDGGRCPVCGRVYQWKLLNHVARDHNMSLKPAHLSYKCTVCTATFGMYKQFENHVYSAHSVVAKRVMDKKPSTSAQPSTSSQGDMLKPLKINDEITIIPQPARAKTKPMTVNRNPQKKV